MPMVGPLLADEIRSAMGFPPPVTIQIIGFATGFVTHFTASGVATKGGIPGPHVISGLNGPAMALLISTFSGFPSVSPELLGFCSGIATYVMANAQVFYVGPPPPTLPDWNVGGTITGLDGGDLANAVAPLMGQPAPSTELTAQCTAMMDHVTNFALVTDGVIA